LVADLVTIGRVGKAHGLAGAFVVEEASEDPDRFAAGAIVRVAGEPAQILESKRAGGRPVIRLDREVERGAELQVDRAELPPPEEGEYYVFQLVGLEVEEEGGRSLGRVVEVTPGPANDVLELEGGLGLPLVDACIQEVDLAAGRILVRRGFAGAD
jgi:16S rRNA processing protein RimM